MGPRPILSPVLLPTTPDGAANQSSGLPPQGIFPLHAPSSRGRRYETQSSTTLPLSPESIVANAFS